MAPQLVQVAKCVLRQSDSPGSHDRWPLFHLMHLLCTLNYNLYNYDRCSVTNANREWRVTKTRERGRAVTKYVQTRRLHLVHVVISAQDMP